MGNSIGSNISLGLPLRGHVEEYKKKVKSFDTNTSIKKVAFNDLLLFVNFPLTDIHQFFIYLPPSPSFLTVCACSTKRDGLFQTSRLL